MIRPNYQMIRRELGRTAAIIINQAERGILYEYIEQHKVPTLNKSVRRNWKRCIVIKQAKEQELEDNTPLPIMYEIHVNGEFYGVTRDLNVKYISTFIHTSGML